MVNFKRKIDSEHAFYQFTKEIYNQWKNSSQLQGISLPDSYEWNTQKERLRKQRDFGKIYSNVNKIYDPVVQQLSLKFWEGEIKNFEKREFTDKGKPSRRKIRQKVREPMWNNSTRMMEPAVYRELEDFVPEFNVKWSGYKQVKEKVLISEAGGELSVKMYQQKRINEVLNCYSSKRWENEIPQGNFGDGSEEELKYQCSNACGKYIEHDLKRKQWKTWEEDEDKPSNNGIEVPYFCSDGCIYQWLKITYPNGEFTCLDLKTDWNKRQFYRCKRCNKVSTKEEYKKGGKFLQSSKKKGIFCSRTCYEKFGNESLEKCVECGIEKDSDKIQEHGGKKFCSTQCHWSWLDKQKRHCLQQLKNLDGWDKLTQEEKESFINKINLSLSNSKLDSIIREVIILVNSKQDEGGDLAKAKSEAIAEIDGKLLEEPAITNEELEEFNRDWSVKIQTANDCQQINKIKSRVLLDISIKRSDKQEDSGIVNLLNQIKDANDYETLSALINRIKKLRDSDNYQKYHLAIEREETRLKNLDYDRYKGETENFFNEFLKNTNSKKEELSKETQQIIDEAIADPEKRSQAEEAICQNVADNKLIEICQEVETKLSKGKLSKKVAKKLVDKIQEIISKNDYQRAAYEKAKNKVDNFLEQLNQKLDIEEQDEEQSLLPKWFWPVAITSVIGVVVVSVVLWIRNGKKKSWK